MTDEQRAHIEQALSTLVDLQPIIANGLLDRRQLAFIDPHHEIAMEALEAVLIAQQAEPVQEPVAWMTHGNDLLPLFHKTKAGALAWGAEPLPLYTAPPQRKPLTIKEINALPEAKGRWPMGMNDRIVRLIRAVEAKHNIKE